jgi:hypothetical protein
VFLCRHKKIEVDDSALDVYNYIVECLDIIGIKDYVVGLRNHIIADCIYSELYHCHHYSYTEHTVIDSICVKCGKCFIETEKEKQKIENYVKKYIKNLEQKIEEKELVQKMFKDKCLGKSREEKLKWNFLNFFKRHRKLE